MTPRDPELQRWAVQAGALAAFESEVEPGEPVRQRRIDAANRDRSAAGVEALRDERASLPEIEFYRRARALGLRRIGS